MTHIPLILKSLLAFYIVAFLIIAYFAFENGMNEAEQLGLFYFATGGAFGLLANRVHEDMKKGKRHDYYP